jgi:hypothetical protein
MSIISAGGAVTGAGGPAGPGPRDYFNTVLYTGTGADRSVTGVGFQPDFVWIKNRGDSSSHGLQDAVRGATKQLRSNSTAAESTLTENVTSFDADGFSLGDNSDGVSVNENTKSYVAWCWKANGAGSSNTDGSITSTVSANTDSGFSIVSFNSGGSSGNKSVGHGLGAMPAMYIERDIDSTDNWRVWHKSFSNLAQDFIWLNLTNAKSSDSRYWANTGPTSTLFNFEVGYTYSLNRDVIGYFFAEIAGYSKFGNYTGNGSATGPSVTTDFEPTFLMIKRTDSTGDWIIHDSARDATNPRTAFLEPNTADAEGSGLDVDFNSTSFQIKSSSATVNANGGTYIYMCIA